MDGFCEPDMVVMMWWHMIQKSIAPKSNCVAILMVGFCDLGRVYEALKYSIKAITKGLQVPIEIMKKLKNDLREVGKKDSYGQFKKKKWKLFQVSPSNSQGLNFLTQSPWVRELVAFGINQSLDCQLWFPSLVVVLWLLKVNLENLKDVD